MSVVLWGARKGDVQFGSPEDLAWFLGWQPSPFFQAAVSTATSPVVTGESALETIRKLVTGV